MAPSNSIPAVSTSARIQLLNWIFRPLDYMDVNFHRYGDEFRCNFGDQYRWVFLNHPDAVKTMFSEDGAAFSAPG
ncbi:cytochrome P450, partial [filamentous cyanobacterium CCP5]